MALSTVLDALSELSYKRANPALVEITTQLEQQQATKEIQEKIDAQSKDKKFDLPDASPIPLNGQ